MCALVLESEKVESLLSSDNVLGIRFQSKSNPNGTLMEPQSNSCLWYIYAHKFSDVGFRDQSL